MKLSWKGMNWLWFAVVTTVAYGVAVVLLLGWSQLFAFFANNPKMNEAADFLAGVFAPVAIIWLVAAVFTQRQELNDTRAQFKNNQTVVDEQLTTIKSQNELLKLQHQQSIANAAKAYRLSLFDKRFQIYEKFIAFGTAHPGGEFDDDDFWTMTNLALEAAFVFDQEMEDWLNEIADQIYHYDQYRQANPLLLSDDGMGNLIPHADERNAELQREYSAYTGWIHDQFQPEVRQSKFWHFMNVSDQGHLKIA